MYFSCVGLVLCGLIHLGVSQSLYFFFQFKIICSVFLYILHLPTGWFASFGYLHRGLSISI